MTIYKGEYIFVKDIEKKIGSSDGVDVCRFIEHITGSNPYFVVGDVLSYWDEYGEQGIYCFVKGSPSHHTEITISEFMDKNRKEGEYHNEKTNLRFYDLPHPLKKGDVIEYIYNKDIVKDCIQRVCRTTGDKRWKYYMESNNFMHNDCCNKVLCYSPRAESMNPNMDDTLLPPPDYNTICAEIRGDILYCGGRQVGKTEKIEYLKQCIEKQEENTQMNNIKLHKSISFVDLLYKVFTEQERDYLYIQENTIRAYHSDTKLPIVYQVRADSTVMIYEEKVDDVTTVYSVSDIEVAINFIKKLEEYSPEKNIQTYITIYGKPKFNIGDKAIIHSTNHADDVIGRLLEFNLIQSLPSEQRLISIQQAIFNNLIVHESYITSLQFNGREYVYGTPTNLGISEIDTNKSKEELIKDVNEIIKNKFPELFEEVECIKEERVSKKKK